MQNKVIWVCGECKVVHSYEPYVCENCECKTIHMYKLVD